MAVIVYDKFYEEKEGNVSPLSCIVTEELNGAYELAMEHPYDEFGKWKRLENDKIIEANTPDGMQPFRIYSVKPTMDRIFVNARHIFYDLLDNYVDSIDITHNASTILEEIKKKMVRQMTFSFEGDLFITEAPKYAVAATLPAGLMYGDVNMDGYITEEDSELLESHVLQGGGVITDATALELADLNGDGDVSSKDYKQLKRIALQGEQTTGYMGDYLGNWSVSDDWGTDFSKRFYVDIAVSEATESKKATVTAGSDILENGFQAVCGNGTIRVYAKNIPLNNLSITFELQEKKHDGGVRTLKAERKNPVELILDNTEGAASMVNLFGGELIRDGYNVKLKEQRGQDRGYRVSYGKNLVGLSVTEEISSVITSFHIIGRDGSCGFYQSGRINDYANVKYGIYENRDIVTSTEARLAAEDLFKAGADLPKVNIEVDFVLLQDTEEYKDYAVLAEVYLGDSVTVINKKMNFSKKAKVIYYEYDSLLKRYNKIELGDFLPNIYNTVTSSATSGVVAKNTAKSAETAVSELSGTLSGIVTVNQDGLYISVDSNNVQTAKKVFHFGQSGLRYSSTGISGTWQTIIGADGKIVQS